MSSQTVHVVEVTDANFGTAVLEESHRRPVVVDFWAAWCQPCRMIGPVLERLADDYQGRFLLAKLDVDANPQAAAAFRIQGIPAVMAFRDGRLANEFVGAIPEQAIRQFIQSVLPTEADGLVAQAEQAEQSGRTDEADRLFAQALELDPNHRQAALGRGRLAASHGDAEAARNFLAPLRPDPEAERLLAAIEVSQWAAPSANGAGPLADAERAAAEGRFRDALEVFLAAVRNGADEDRERAREAMLKVFSVLGDDDPLTAEYRRRLASALY
jgi:putative thioredoxin